MEQSGADFSRTCLQLVAIPIPSVQDTGHREIPRLFIVVLGEEADGHLFLPHNDDQSVVANLRNG